MNQNKLLRLLQVIDMLYEKSPGMLIRDIAQRLQTTERTAYRYMQLFEAAGFQVIRSFTGRYSIYKGNFNSHFLYTLKSSKNGTVKSNLSGKPETNRIKRPKDAYLRKKSSRALENQ